MQAFLTAPLLMGAVAVAGVDVADVLCLKVLAHWPEMWPAGYWTPSPGNGDSIVREPWSTEQVSSQLSREQIQNQEWKNYV